MFYTEPLWWIIFLFSFIIHMLVICSALQGLTFGTPYDLFESVPSGSKHILFSVWWRRRWATWRWWRTAVLLGAERWGGGRTRCCVDMPPFPGPPRGSTQRSMCVCVLPRVSIRRGRRALPVTSRALGGIIVWEWTGNVYMNTIWQCTCWNIYYFIECSFIISF